MRALFDTNILIDHLNGIAAASKEIVRYRSPTISQITWMEVMAGANSENERKTLRPFLASFEITPLNTEVMEKARQIARPPFQRLGVLFVRQQNVCERQYAKVFLPKMP